MERQWHRYAAVVFNGNAKQDTTVYVVDRRRNSVLTPFELVCVPVASLTGERMARAT